MVEKLTLVIPLGRDLMPDGRKVCHNTVVRIETANKLARELDAVLMAAPGCDQEHMVTTMAVLMMEHIPEDQRMVINTTDRSVWGTLGEMVWCVQYARERFGCCGLKYRFVFVTSKRHGRRVRMISKLFSFFRGEDISTVDAEDEQISLLKEILLAYPKLFFLKLVEVFGGDPSTFKLPILHAKRGNRASLRQLGSIMKRR